jgi:hypothetical protein
LYNEWTQQATIDQVIKACFGLYRLEN